MIYVVEARRKGKTEELFPCKRDEKASQITSVLKGTYNTIIHILEKAWFALYRDGRLFCIVDNERLEELMESGQIAGKEWKNVVIWNKKVYDTWEEALESGSNSFIA